MHRRWGKAVEKDVPSASERLLKLWLAELGPTRANKEATATTLEERVMHAPLGEELRRMIRAGTRQREEHAAASIDSACSHLSVMANNSIGVVGSEGPGRRRDSRATPAASTPPLLCCRALPTPQHFHMPRVILAFFILSLMLMAA